MKIFEKLRNVDLSNRIMTKVIIIRMAKINCELRKTAEASSLVSQALEIDAKCVIAASIQAECLLQNNQLEETVLKCDEILASEVPSVVMEEVGKTRAKAVRAIEKLKSIKIDRNTEKITEQNKKSENVRTKSDEYNFGRTKTKNYIDLATHLIAQKDFDRALEEAGKASQMGLHICISIPEAILCFLSLGMQREVVTLNNTLNDKTIATNLVLLNECNAMLENEKEKKIEDLLQCVENAQTIAPASVEYRNLKIGYLIKLGRYIDAEKIISEVLKMHPKQFRMIYFQCLSYYYQGELNYITERLNESFASGAEGKEARDFRRRVADIMEHNERGKHNENTLDLTFC